MAAAPIAGSGMKTVVNVRWYSKHVVPHLGSGQRLDTSAPVEVAVASTAPIWSGIQDPAAVGRRKALASNLKYGARRLSQQFGIIIRTNR